MDSAGMADSSIYGMSWYASRTPELEVRSPLSIEFDVDVCVIGGGLAGLTVALEVARRGWSVAVLEAGRIAWNASGRNTGIVRPGFAADPDAVAEKVGPDPAKRLWALAGMGVDHVRRTIHDAGIAGAETNESGLLHVSRTANGRAVADHAERLEDAFGVKTEFWPTEQVRANLRSTRYFSGIHFPDAFSINPLNYALGLAAAAEAAGARIFEQTPALEIDPAGVRKRITTPSARLRAGHVVLAGNVHIGGLMPELADTLVPVWAYSIVTSPLGDALRDAVRFRGAVTDNDRGDSSHRIVDGDRLLWSDRSTVWDGNPRRHARALLAAIRRTYPGLGPIEAEYAWSGSIGATVHRMPQIGELSPGVWLLSGFDRHGLNTTAMGGVLISRAILDGDQDWRAFQPFDLVWAGGKLGRAAVQTAIWYRRAREALQGALARRAHPGELPPAEELPAEAPAEPAPERAPRRRRKSKAAVEDSAQPAG
jgi:gamma-glutamylputrescine oxidase